MKYLSVAAVLTLTSSAFADLVTNGSFETGPSPGAGYATIPAVDSTTISGWTVSSGTVDYIGGATPYWSAAPGDGGSASLDMNGNGTGVIQQTLTTVAGQDYYLTFALSVNPDAGAGASRTLQYDVGAGGADLSGTVTATVSNTQSVSQMEWAYYTFSFTASGTSTLLQFTGDGGGSSFGPALDQVSVTPEPGTFLLFGAGLAGLGLWRRSKTKQSRAAKA